MGDTGVKPISLKETLNSLKKSADFLIASSEILSKVATFFIIPVSGLFLSTGEFNMWVIIFPSIQILSSALSFGMPNYLLRAHFVGKIGKRVNSMPIYNAFLILSAISAVLFASVRVLYGNSPFLSWLIFFLLISNSFLLIIQQKYQAERNGVRYFNQSLVWRLGFAFVLVIFFVFKLKIDLDFLLASLLGIQIFLLVVAVYQECWPFWFELNLAEQNKIFKFGFPLFLVGALQYITFMNSRYFVYNKVEVNETAIFSLVHTFVGALNLLFVVFVRIYIPKLFEVLNGSRAQTEISLYKKLVFSSLEILTLFIFAALFIYSEMYRNNFEADIFKLTPILIIGQYFYCFQIFVIDSLLYYGKTGKLFLISSMSAICSVVIGYFLIQYFGIYGAAFGVAFTQLISLIIVLFFTFGLFKKILGFRFCIWKLLRIAMIMALSYMSLIVVGKLIAVPVFLIYGCYLIWKLNLPVLYKEFL